jgi:hypothetical protein
MVSKRDIRVLVLVVLEGVVGVSNLMRGREEGRGGVGLSDSASSSSSSSALLGVLDDVEGGRAVGGWKVRRRDLVRTVWKCVLAAYFS